MALAFIGLGANLGDPRAQVRAALAALGGIPATRLLGRSSLYLSAPVGHAAQPDFVNAVAMVETTLAPRALLEALLDIERGFGRERSFANAPRTLDLDLLLYDASAPRRDRAGHRDTGQRRARAAARRLRRAGGAKAGKLMPPMKPEGPCIMGAVAFMFRG